MTATSTIAPTRHEPELLGQTVVVIGGSADEAYPKWQAWMREKQPRLLVLWGKHDLSFELSEPEAYRRDVPKADVHVLDAGHFALDTAADQIAQLVRNFMK